MARWPIWGYLYLIIGQLAILEALLQRHEALHAGPRLLPRNSDGHLQGNASTSQPTGTGLARLNTSSVWHNASLPESTSYQGYGYSTASGTTYKTSATTAALTEETRRSDIEAKLPYSLNLTTSDNTTLALNTSKPEENAGAVADVIPKGKQKIDLGIKLDAGNTPATSAHVETTIYPNATSFTSSGSTSGTYASGPTATSSSIALPKFFKTEGKLPKIEDSVLTDNHTVMADKGTNSTGSNVTEPTGVDRSAWMTGGSWSLPSNLTRPSETHISEGSRLDATYSDPKLTSTPSSSLPSSISTRYMNSSQLTSGPTGTGRLLNLSGLVRSNTSSQPSSQPIDTSRLFRLPSFMQSSDTIDSSISHLSNSSTNGSTATAVTNLTSHGPDPLSSFFGNFSNGTLSSVPIQKANEAPIPSGVPVVVGGLLNRLQNDSCNGTTTNDGTVTVYQTEFQYVDDLRMGNSTGPPVVIPTPPCFEFILTSTRDPKDGRYNPIQFGALPDSTTTSTLLVQKLRSASADDERVGKLFAGPAVQAQPVMGGPASTTAAQKVAATPNENDKPSPMFTQDSAPTVTPPPNSGGAQVDNMNAGSGSSSSSEPEAGHDVQAAASSPSQDGANMQHDSVSQEQPSPTQDANASPTPRASPNVFAAQYFQPSNNQPSNDQTKNAQSSANQQPSNQQPSNQQPSNQQPNTQQPNTQQPNTQQPNGQPVINQPSNNQPGSNEPANTQPDTGQPAGKSEPASSSGGSQQAGSTGSQFKDSFFGGHSPGTGADTGKSGNAGDSGSIGSSGNAGGAGSPGNLGSSGNTGSPGSTGRSGGAGSSGSTGSSDSAGILGGPGHGGSSSASEGSHSSVGSANGILFDAGSPGGASSASGHGGADQGSGHQNLASGFYAQPAHNGNDGNSGSGSNGQVTSGNSGQPNFKEQFFGGGSSSGSSGGSSSNTGGGTHLTGGSIGSENSQNLDGSSGSAESAHGGTSGSQGFSNSFLGGSKGSGSAAQDGSGTRGSQVQPIFPLPGAQPSNNPSVSTNVGGTPVKLESQNVVIGTQTFDRGSSPTSATVNGQTFKWDSNKFEGPAGNIPFPAANAKSPAVVAGGEQFVIRPSQIEFDGKTIPRPTDSKPMPFAANDQLFYINPSQIISPETDIPFLPTTTAKAQPKAFAYDGDTLSADRSYLFAGSTSIPIPDSGIVDYKGKKLDIKPDRIVAPDTTIPFSLPPGQTYSPVTTAGSLVVSVRPSGVRVGNLEIDQIPPNMSPITTSIGDQRVEIGPSGIKVGTAAFIPLPTAPPTSSSPDKSYRVLNCGQFSVTMTDSTAIIDGHTFTCPPGSSTTSTVIGNRVVKIGPSGVHFDATTVDLPVITPTPETTAQAISVGATQAVIGGKTYPVGPGASSQAVTLGDEVVTVGPEGVVVPAITLSNGIVVSATTIKPSGSATSSSAGFTTKTGDAAIGTPPGAAAPQAYVPGSTGGVSPLSPNSGGNRGAMVAWRIYPIFVFMVVIAMVW